MKRAAPLLAAGLFLLPVTLAYRRGRAARALALRPAQELAPGRRAEWPFVTVIVPAWRERGTLEGCLADLRALDYPAFEIIVAAGGPDGTYEAAQGAALSNGRLRVIPQRVDGGKNGAMNDAARLARGEILVFLDADSRVEPGWLKALVAALGTTGEYAAGTGLAVPERHTPISLAGEMNHTLEYEARGRVSLQGSASMALRRVAWESLGGLPEGPYADDWDLNARLGHAGLRVSHAREARVRSDRPATLREWWNNELRWRRVHLTSLFRVAAAEMPDARSALRALYPYIVAWGLVGLGLAAAVSKPLLPRAAGLTRAVFAGAVAFALGREVGGVAETVAYTGDRRWLAAAPVLPALTVLGWGASALATLTARKAPVHFKGARRAPGTDAPAAPDPVVGAVERVDAGTSRELVA